MTGIDSETSQDIAEAISLKGGRYLEAQIQGSKNQAQDGTLVILVAGDRSLFDDCQSCFQVNVNINTKLRTQLHYCEFHLSKSPVISRSFIRGKWRA